MLRALLSGEILLLALIAVSAANVQKQQPQPRYDKLVPCNHELSGVPVSVAEVSQSQSQSRPPVQRLDAERLTGKVPGASNRRVRNGDSQPEMPRRVRKMGLDAGEKFFPEYWHFSGAEEDQTTLADLREEDGQSPQVTRLRSRSLPNDNGESSNNMTMLFQPFLPHMSGQSSSSDLFGGSGAIPNFLRAALKASRSLEKRAFTCPGGTSLCSNIQRYDSCCATTETCQLIPNGPLGDVGCCPQGRTCSGSLNQCEAGYTSCPGLGNGCCIPNFKCVQGGCAPNVSTITATTTSSTKVTSSTPSSTTEVKSMTTTVLVTETGTTRVTTTIVTTAIQTSTSTSQQTTTQPPSSSSSSSSTPTSTSQQATTSSNTNDPNPVIRPTTVSTSNTITSSSNPNGPCPTGFYQCSAIYHGGCCRVGRDCGISSCPVTESTTIINTRGITLVVPAGVGAEAKITPGASNCATGWYLCSPDQNGGCCPSGYDCRTDSECTAAPQNTLRLTGEVPKGQPFTNHAAGGTLAVLRMGWWIMILLFIGSSVILMRG